MKSQPIGQGVYFSGYRLAMNRLNVSHWPGGEIGHSLNIGGLVNEIRGEKPDQDVLLCVPRNDLPRDLKFFFENIPGLREDFTSLCDYFAFGTCLLQRQPDGLEKPVSAFTISFDAVSVGERPPVLPGAHQGRGSGTAGLEAIFGARLVPHLERTIFVSLFADGRHPRSGWTLFPAPLHELGHLKNHQLLRAAGYRLFEVGPAAHEFYANHYEREAVLNWQNFLAGLFQGRNEAAVSTLLDLTAQTLRQMGLESVPERVFLRAIFDGMEKTWLPELLQKIRGYYAGFGANDQVYDFSKSPELLGTFEHLAVSVK